MNHSRFVSPRRQRGVVLVVSLLLLLVLALISAASMNATVMEEKMAANHQYKTVSFQIAESAIERHIARPVQTLERALALPADDFSFADDLGNGFDPVAGGRVASAATATVRYCGERVAERTGINAEVSLGVPKYKLQVLDVRGDGHIPAQNATVSNERQVGALLAAGVPLRGCPSPY